MKHNQLAALAVALTGNLSAMRGARVYPAMMAALMLSLPYAAQAERQYFEGSSDSFKAVYPNSSSQKCLSCHTDVDPDASGIKTTNAYGKAFDNLFFGNVKSALLAIEPQDSDGDGYTNLTEIASSTATLKAYPGNKASVPAKVLFVDNFGRNETLGLNWNKAAGVWNIASGKLASKASANALISPTRPAAGLNAFKAGSISAKVQLGASSGTAQAFMVFSLKGAGSASAYRYVGLYKNQVTIGQKGVFGGVSTSTAIKVSKNLGVVSNVVKVVLASTGKVDVYINNQTLPTASFKFPTTVLGKVGLMTGKTQVTFDDFAVSK